MFYHLWRGQTETVLAYVQTSIVAKNILKLQDLITYLTKHQREIINYGQRQNIGKTIGSGRGEKAVDQVVGWRRKNKSMSWRNFGSKSLAILKTLELNNLWDSSWWPHYFAL